MKKKILILEIILLATFVLDMFFHFMSAKIANPLLFLFLATSIYLFKPYFIWSDLTKRRKEQREQEEKERFKH